MRLWLLTFLASMFMCSFNAYADPASRTKATYFFDFSSKESFSKRFALSQVEIQELRSMALGGDGVAGVRLYKYYTHTVLDASLAEEAIEMVPRGNGIGEYNIKAFMFRLPNGETVGMLSLCGDETTYLQKKQVVPLTSLAASGNREAAERLSEYYARYVRNVTLAGTFHKFALGDDSVLPAIKMLDAKFQQGDLELVRKSSPIPENIWPF